MLDCKINYMILLLKKNILVQNRLFFEEIDRSIDSMYTLIVTRMTTTMILIVSFLFLLDITFFIDCFILKYETEDHNNTKFQLIN